MRSFEYLRPASLEEACAALAAAGDQGAADGPVKALAGGTDLIVQMKQGGLRPRALVSLQNVPGLSYVRLTDDGGLAIGAATALAAVEDSTVVRESFPAVGEAASCIGSVQVRSRATVGGNLCNAAPSADMAPILIAHGVEAVITDGRAERSLLLEDFFTGPGETVLRRGELLAALRIPPAPPRSYAKYHKTFRSAMDCCTVGVAVFAVFSPDGAVGDARLALGAVAPTPIRAREAEKSVIGRRLGDDVIADAGARAAAEALPISDVRASASYRKTLVEVLTKRALRGARAWAEKGASS
ncbi:MAG TPA: xanthine dehydrogenase family protein subunit M [Thermoleophilia bacterium]|nr:xanthine dehydrogenase family protein subunit M [Thermoleophilia bacterium]